MMLELDLVQVGWVVHNNLYAIKLLQSKGLDKTRFACCMSATVASKLVYSAPTWWGFTKACDRKSCNLYYIVREDGIFMKEKQLSQKFAWKGKNIYLELLCVIFIMFYVRFCHVKNISYNLCKRGHNRELPSKSNALVPWNFFNHLLYDLV